MSVGHMAPGHPSRTDGSRKSKGPETVEVLRNACGAKLKLSLAFGCGIVCTVAHGMATICRGAGISGREDARQGCVVHRPTPTVSWDLSRPRSPLHAGRQPHAT